MQALHGTKRGNSPSKDKKDEQSVSVKMHARGHDDGVPKFVEHIVGDNIDCYGRPHFTYRQVKV